MNYTDVKSGDKFTATADIVSNGARFRTGDVVTVRVNGRAMNHVLAVNGRTKTMRAITYADFQKWFTEAK